MLEAFKGYYETSLIFESHTHIKSSNKQQGGMNFQHLSAACCFLDTDAMSIQWTWSDANLLKRGQGSVLLGHFVQELEFWKQQQQ